MHSNQKLKKSSWLVNKAMVRTKNSISNLQESIKQIKNAKECILQHPKFICSNVNTVQQILPDVVKGQQNSEQMYENMTNHLHQYGQSVVNFQQRTKNLFDKIYINIRKLLFDYFNTDIEVKLLDIQVGFVYYWVADAMVRFKFDSHLSDKKLY